MTTVSPSDAKHVQQEKYNVHVSYIAADKPYVEPQAAGSETLEQLKARALDSYGLVEGPVDSGQKMYDLAFDQVVQTNMSQTISQLAAGQHHLKLMLVERFVQG